MGLLVGIASQAAATPWQRHVESGLQALSKGRIEEADRCFHRCLPFVERKNRDPELLFDDFSAIATAYMSMKDYDRAVVWARRAVEGMEKLRGPVHQDLVTPLFLLGSVHLAADRMEQAAPLLERACRVSWRCGLKPGEELGSVTQLLVLGLRADGKEAQARQLSEALAGVSDRDRPLE